MGYIGILKQTWLEIGQANYNLVNLGKQKEVSNMTTGTMPLDTRDCPAGIELPSTLTWWFLPCACAVKVLIIWLGPSSAKKRSLVSLLAKNVFKVVNNSNSALSPAEICFAALSSVSMISCLLATAIRWYLSEAYADLFASHKSYAETFIWLTKCSTWVRANMLLRRALKLMHQKIWSVSDASWTWS